MGTEEKVWIDVANDLLSKCHIHRRIKKLSECDAHMFVALYEAILGECVPDFIPVSRSQEDDAHNIQAVIDSLALDYLQVSLSHITGENIVKGDKESIKNLLEIFDGLLEYLTEQISEASSRAGDDAKSYSKGAAQRPLLEEPPYPPEESLPGPGAPLVVGSSAQSSEIRTPSSDVEGSESTAELIRLGDTAHTFLLRKSVPEFKKAGELQREKSPNATWTKEAENVQVASEVSGQVSSRREVTDRKNGLADQVPCKEVPSDSLRYSAKKLGEPIRSAIPLQPPYQPLEFRPAPQARRERGGSDAARLSQISVQGTAGVAAVSCITEPVRPIPETRPAVVPEFSTCEDDLPAGNEKPVSKENRNIQQTVGSLEELPGTDKMPESSSGAAFKRVAFRSLPDVKLLTLRSDVGEKDEWESISEEGEEEEEEEDTTLLEQSTAWELPERAPSRQRSENEACSKEWEEDITALFADEALSHRRARYLMSEQELREKSEKLSQRLQELDLMLKRALSEKSQVDESRDEDKLSQHSDSFMEYRRQRYQPATPHRKSQQSRARSLSSSPPPLASRYTCRTQFEDVLNKDARDQMGRVMQKEPDQQKIKPQVISTHEEPKNYRDTERVRLSKLKEKLHKTEQEFKEAIFKEPAKRPESGKVYSKREAPRSARGGQRMPSRALIRPRKVTSMKIKDNDLLPLLVEEFPYLHISPHTLNQMWKRQLGQLEQLTKSASEEDRSRVKLLSEVETTQKKHDLLVEIIKKEQGHNQRLQEFKELIRQQKSMQNKVRERRQQTIRAKKYYEDYHVQLRAKMLRARTREERMFKNLFEEGLEIQKQRLREVRLYAKEKREAQKKRFEDELQSMENYYKDQFSMLAEAVSQERKEIHTREKAQAKTLQKLRRELRAKMEKEIQELQQLITKSNDDTFYCELEAERLKRKVQMASFYHSKTHLS
ncbi:centrosomal protein of 95 kDa [Microcaecilia unicolor]|uniref:Centrosomal protein of 95 kDa n=1 Tax=Microcaecilia unicolor TaxID=1415580 RepID=A0A6P7YA07_9AMPH|nr:centrosomal protein of 95 kDa [Microcaecilia unicolor]